MDVTKMYIPNPEKWLNFYRNKSTGKMDTHFIRQRGGNTQIGGSLMSQSESDVLPNESPKPIAEQKSTDNVRLEMVAPAKHAVDEAKTVVRRVRTQLKKRTTVKRNTSLKRRRTRRFSKKPLLAEQLKKRRNQNTKKK